jgi:stage II sporulation protein AA (anti-sigma F factor antagonist)
LVYFINWFTIDAPDNFNEISVMPISKTINGDSAELRLSGKLTFLNGSEFHNQLNEILNRKIKSLSIHLDELTFMDSAGLGMLMITHKECNQRDIPLTIYHPIGDVKILLQMTKSYERFNIVG